MPSEEQTLASAQSPSLTELLTLVNSLKHQLDTQKTELTQQISQLQTELAQVRQQPASTTALLASAPQPQTTSRRRMLGKVFTSFAGAAALAAGGAALTATSPALAATWGFSDGSTNVADRTTTISAQNSTNGAYPLFTFVNGNNTSANTDLTNPDSQPIGVYARSDQYVGVYGQGGSQATGVVGVSNGPASSATNSAFIANYFGGVVGSSNTNAGVVGISTQTAGVTGVGVTGYGVSAVSLSGTGGIFGVDSTADFNQGAALRVVPKTTAGGSPTGTTYTHSQGEVHLDKFARVFVCNASFIGSSGSNEPAVANKPRVQTFPTGPTSTAAASWQLLAPMAVRTSSPSAAFAATNGRDQALHSIGELWLDRTTGKLYVCNSPGANDLNTVNADLQTKLGITGLPNFVPVGSGGGFNFYPNLSLYKVRIIAEGFDAGTTPLPYGQSRSYNIPQVIANYPIPNNGKLRLTQPPAGFSAIFGTLTIYAPGFSQGTGAFTTGQYLSSSPGSSATTLVLAASKNQEKVSNFVVLPVDSSGVLSFQPNNSTIAGDTMYISFDMFGYIL